MFCPSFAASNSTRFSPCTRARTLALLHVGVRAHLRTFELLYSMSALHLPETSPVSVLPRRIFPAIALYVPEK